MPPELRADDEVTDWQYQWQGPDGAETWWPTMPFVHAQIFLVTLFPAFLLGVLIAWGFGTGLVSRVVPVLACLALTWFAVSEWVKHVDPARPIAWHRAVVRTELRAPRPPRPRSVTVVATSAAALLDQAGADVARTDAELDAEATDEDAETTVDETTPEAPEAQRTPAHRVPAQQPPSEEPPSELIA